MTESGADQRVRACLACGELVAFDDRSCPSCGHYEALAGTVETGPEVSCRRCDRSMHAELLFCPRCGAEQADRPPSSTSAVGDATAARDGRASLVVLAFTLLGPAALAAVVFGLLA